MIVDKNNKRVFIAENWKEKFRIELSGVLWYSIKNGEPLPRWYLPVRLSGNRDAIECWIMPLAPLALFFYITVNILYTIWFDLFRWGKLIQEWRQKH